MLDQLGEGFFALQVDRQIGSFAQRLSSGVRPTPLGEDSQHPSARGLGEVNEFVEQLLGRTVAPR